MRAELATAGADIEAHRPDHLVDRHTAPRERVRRGPHVVTGYPGLVDRGTSVDVRVFPTAAERDPAHRRGVRRLLLLETPSPARAMTRDLDNAARAGPVPQPARLARRAARRLRHGVRRRADHRGRWPGVGRGVVREAARGDRAKLESTTARVLDAVRAVLTVWHRVQARIGRADRAVAGRGAPRHPRQVNALVGPGFVTAAGTARLGDVARYLEAVERRMEKLRADPTATRVDGRGPGGGRRVRRRAGGFAGRVEPSPELHEIRWMIEELRVACTRTRCAPGTRCR